MHSSLSEIAEEIVTEVTRRLTELSAGTDGFRNVKARHFDCPATALLLMRGKGLSAASTPDESRALWRDSAAAFRHDRAATAALTEGLLRHAELLLDHVIETTRNFEAVTEEWIVANPSCLPVLTNSMGNYSKKQFKQKYGINAASNRKVGITDAARIRRAFGTETIKSRGEIMTSLYRTVEGISRDLVGKVVNEGFVKRPLEQAGIRFAQDGDKDAASAITGLFTTSKADFVIPDRHSPQAFIEVRGCDSQHASVYASQLCDSVANRCALHPDCLSILVYDKWNKASLARLARFFDYLFPIQDSWKAVEIVKLHLSGKSMKRNVVSYLVERRTPEHVPSFDLPSFDADDQAA